MKEVRAYIKPHMLSKVSTALHKIEGLTGMSVLEVKGYGRGKAKDAPHRIVDGFVEYMPCVKIEVICKDELVDPVVTAIQQNAHTGLRGDGKIYVSGIEQAVRISTGEQGEVAV